MKHLLEASERNMTQKEFFQRLDRNTFAAESDPTHPE